MQKFKVYNPENEKKEMISVNLTILPLINEDNDGRTGEKDSFRNFIDD